MARNYTVSFNITGAMDGSLLAAIQSAQNALKGLGNSARAVSNAAKLTGLAGKAQSLNAIQAAAQKFRELKKATVETQKALANAQTTAQRLGREYSQSNAERLKEIAKLKDELKDLQKSREASSRAETQGRGSLKYLRDQRAELKEQLKALGAKGRKIPRELLGTAKGREIGQLLTRLNENKAALEAQRQKFRQARDEAKKYAQQIRETQNALKTQERLAAQSGQEFNAARGQVQNLKATLQTQLEALQRLRSQLGAAGFNTSTFVASERALQSEIERVNSALQRQQQLLQAQGQFGTSLSNLSNAWGEFQNSLSTAQTLTSPFTSAIDKAIQFEHTMSTLKSISQMDLIKAGDTAQVERNMARLTAQAKELGATTIYTAQQVGEAQVYIARTGWDTDAIIKSMPSILKLAAANRMDIEPTADIVTNIMTAFGHGVDQVEKDADVFAYTVTHSNQTLSQFGEAMKYAAPVAKLFGASIEEAAMMTKFMGDAGIQGSMAGTSMRQTMLRLTAPPKKASKAMDELGVSTSDATKSWNEAQEVAASYGVTLDSSLSAGRQFISIMEQIDRGFAGRSDREKLAAMSAITGINAVSGAANVFGAGAKQAKNFTELLEQCRGALEQTYATMTDDTFGAQKSFESAWEAVQLSMGESLLGISRAGYEFAAPLLTSLSQFIDANPAIVQGCAAIAAALSGIIVSAAAVRLAFAGWGFITSTINLVRVSLAALGSGAMLSGLLGRLTALRTALFGLNGAATLGGWSAMFSAIALRATAARTAIVGFFASLSVSSMISGAVGALRSLGSAILGAARAAMLFALSPVGAALMALALAGLYCYQNWEKVAPVLSNIAGIITGSLSGALSTIAPAIQNVMAAFENLGNALGSSGLLSTLGMLITGALSTIATAIAGALSTVINVVATIISTVANMLSGLVNLISNVLSGNWSAAWESAKSIAIAAFEGIRDVVTGILDGIISTIENVGKAWNFLRGKEPSGSHGDVHGGGGGEFSSSTPAPAPMIDTSATQAEVDALGTSAQSTATDMSVVPETLSQIPASIQPTTEAIAQIPTAIQPTVEAIAQVPEGLTTAVSTLSDALIQLGTEALNAATQLQTDTVALQMFGAATMTDMVALQMMGAAALSTGVALQMMGAEALGAVGGITSLGNAASSAASEVSGLGAAAQSACSQLAAAGANAAAQVSSAASSAWSSIKSFVGVGGGGGGSFARGGLVEEPTFFAGEHGREMIIPLTEHHRRATNLWRAAGQMLGILPTTEGRKPDWSIKRVPRLPGGLKMPRINFPELVAGSQSLGASPQPLATSNQPLATNITINVTVNGNADEATVRRGVEQSLPKVRTFAEELGDWRREQLRRSFR